ncbi:MAG: O-antigen ligase family protein [Anaerolinea sp.]|nr:O-antigen ligase family protein [Anaerolinea sp.]
MKLDTGFRKFQQIFSGHYPYSSMLIRVPFILLMALAVSLPFELIAPLWTIGPLSITNVELALFLTLAFAAASLLQSRGKWAWPDRYWLWLLPFGGGLLLSALLAPQLQANALKASLRLIFGILLALAALQIMRRPGDGRAVSVALLAGGLAAALIGWWEISQSELAWMSLFRTHITRVGSILRLTGAFDYANQAAIFMEATLPFLVTITWSVSAQSIPPRFKIPLLALLFSLTLFYLQAIILTLSRAGAATVIVVCLVLTILLAVRQTAANRKMAAWWLGVAMVTAVLIVANALLSAQIRLRLQGGNVDDWYRAQIIAPPTLEMVAGATVDAAVVVTNEGALAWRSQGENPISLGARLLNEEGTQAYSELRWPFPGSVNPQETVHMIAPLTAPLTPGIYELRWDVVHENVTWFGSKSGLYATSLVTVLPGAGPIDRPQPETFGMSEQAAWDYVGPVPGRATLWSLALQMIGERPLLGIGMDNFRLTYGERLGNPNYDNTVHTNNFYLEIIVAMGIIGAFPFIVWAGALLLDVLRTLRRPDQTMWSAAFAAGLLTFFIHGFFDFFLLFNATGLLFWLLTALWVNEKKNHAHRI